MAWIINLIFSLIENSTKFYLIIGSYKNKTAVISSCPEGFEDVLNTSSYCYMFGRSTKNWTMAEQECRSYNGSTLITFSNREMIPYMVHASRKRLGGGNKLLYVWSEYKKNACKCLSK